MPVLLGDKSAAPYLGSTAIPKVYVGSDVVLSGGVVPPVPVNTVAPVVSGTPQQGQVLSITNGTWTNTPTGYTYTWKRAGVAISGAAASTYTLVAGDVGALISCDVTASNANGSATASSNNVGPVTAAAVALDAPIPASEKSTTLLAFGASRQVSDWAGPSLNGKNSDTVANFQNGFDLTSGRELASALPANATLVDWIDQMGSGARLTATGSPVLSASGIAPRFATQDDPGGSGQQVRLTDRGGTGVNLAAASHLSVQIPFLLSSGTDQLEIHVRWSPNKRVARAGDVTSNVPNGNDPLNGLNTRNNILALGTNLNNRFHSYIGGGGSGVDNVNLVTNGGTALAMNGKNSQGNYRFPQNSQFVTTHVFTSTSYKEYENGVLTKSFNFTAQQTTDILAGALNNPTLAIGAVFGSAANASLLTTNRGDITVGALIVTKNSSLARIRRIQARMSLDGQQHLAENLDVIMGWMKDLVYFTRANASTGRVSGVKGFINFLFNTAGNFTFNYTDPVTGMKGIRANDNSATNSFQSDESFDWSRTGVTLIDFGKLESGSLNNNVQVSYALTKGSPQADTSDQAIMMLGHHHAVPAFGTKPGNGRDVTNIMGRRKLIDLVTMFAYDFLEQTLVKYNYWLGLIRRNTTEVINTSQTNNVNLTLTAAVLENTDPSAPFKLDNPVKQMLPDNVTYLYKYSQEQLLIAVHEPSTVHNYDSPSSSTFFTARNRLYVSGGGIMPIGHMDGSKGVFENAPVMQGDGTERLQSCAYQSQAFKDREEFAFFPYPATELQVRVLAANWHKVQEAA